MSPEDFKHLRKNKLNLTQAELAKALCVPRIHVERLERSRAPQIPGMTARLMRAFEEGFRPRGWPKDDDVWSG